VEISISAQAAAFGGAILIGMAVGLGYDLIRIPRAYIHIPLLGEALDLLFWLLVTVVLFLYAMTAGDGEVRIFMAIALFGGAVFYFLVLSPWIRRFSALMVSAVTAIWRFITFPLVQVARVFKKMLEILKNIFSSCSKWYKIKRIPGEEEAAAGRERIGKRGRHRWRKPKRQDS